jgi:hypothetical protein
MAIDTIKSTAVLDGAIATADLANDIAINTSGAITTTGAFTSQGIDDNSNATAITIDSSENVLITKTATGIATVGSELKATGELLATVNNDACAFLNRKSSDGEIINLRKDGSTVGAIGTTGGDVTIDGGSEHTGLRFESTQITPRHNSAYSNNWTGLGTASNRFKDLYLGDGIYLGGTGAANKLDDYEEGTWTVQEKNGQGGTMTTNRAHYTKIGNLVHAFASVEVGTTTNNNTLNFTLPFASSINGYYLGAGSVSYHQLATGQSNNLRPNIENAADNVFFFYGDNSSPDVKVTAAQASTKRMDFYVTYHTHA